MVLVWAVLVQVLVVRAFAGGLLPPEPAFVLEPCRIDVNRAGIFELLALPAVGPVRAEALVLERVRNGRFDGLADLSRVRGFGPATLAGIAEFVAF